jgi:hypothetical protein
MTQNRLDLAVAGEAAWSDDMRAQYAEISQSIDAELLVGAKWHGVQVTSLGLASAAAQGDVTPAAGESTVLRLKVTGIERSAIVTRRDPGAGRVDLTFDTLSGLQIVPIDAPVTVTIRIVLAPESESLVAVTDVLIGLDRLIARVGDPDELPRLIRISKSSPLEIVLIGRAALGSMAKLFERVAAARKTWYEGTKQKYEAEGIAIDNEHKRRAIEVEANRAFIAALEAEEGSTLTPILDGLRVAELEVGEPNTMTRRQFIDSCRAAVTIPMTAVVSSVVDSTSTRRRRR